MLFLQFFRWLLGYVEFQITGGFAERFFNICTHNGIGLWNFRRRSEEGPRVFSARVRAKAYRRLPRYARTTGVRVRLRKKAGLPLLMLRYRKRSGILIGALIFFGILALMSRFVWSVQIVGNENLPDQDILDTLQKVGVYSGMPKADLNISEAELKMVLEMEELSWIALNLKGTSLTVEVRERRMPPDMVPDDIPCSIYAEQSAIIRQMEVYAGWKAVKVGDSVASGDLLVSGILEPPPPPETSSGATSTPQEPTRFTHARARIIGETLHTKTIDIPFKQIIKERTGENRIYRQITLFSLQIPLWIGNRDSAPAEVSEKNDWLRVFGITLPISVKTLTHHLTAESTLTLSGEEAERMAETQLADYEKENLSGISILDRKVQKAVMEDRCTLYAQYICLEEIGMEEQIGN